ncbi:MAG: hypothetical protein ACYTGH_17870, partial [Planctomycetota bacterium]
MSFFDYVFDSEWRQRSDIEDLKRRARRQQRAARSGNRQANAKVASLEARVDELEEQMGALQLLNRALIETLRQSPGWN